MKTKELTFSRLVSLIEYNPATGKFVWRNSGDICCTETNLGYHQIKIDGVAHSAHRLAWLYVYGKWPDGEIDHKNGNRSDNRLVNLRDVDRKVNAQNVKKMTRKSRTGLMGVHPGYGGMFLAYISCDRHSILIGKFHTKEEAQKAYINAKYALHPGFTGPEEVKDKSVPLRDVMGAFMQQAA